MSLNVVNPYRFSVSQHYSTDFTSHGDWSANTTHLNIVNNRLEWELTTTGMDEFMNLDLSSLEISDTEWCLRYEFEFTTLNENDDDNLMCNIGMYSGNSPSGAYPNGNWLRYGTYVNKGFANILAGGAGCTGGSSCEQKIDVGNDPFSLTTAVDTTYYIETKRVSATQLEQRVYTGSFGGTQVLNASSTMTNSLITSSYDDTQFLTIHLFNQGSVYSGGYTGFINQLDFFNNSSVPF
jgi:hypothetical protein